MCETGLVLAPSVDAVCRVEGLNFVDPSLVVNNAMKQTSGCVRSSACITHTCMLSDMKTSFWYSVQEIIFCCHYKVVQTE